MTIFKFIQEVESTLRNNIPGEFNIYTNVDVNDESFIVTSDIKYTSENLLQDNVLRVLDVELNLGSNLEYTALGTYIYPGKRIEESSLEDTLKTLKDTLLLDRTQILFNSIIKK